MEMHTPSPLRIIYVQRTISLDNDVLRDLQKQSRKHFLLLKETKIIFLEGESPTSHKCDGGLPLFRSIKKCY